MILVRTPLRVALGGGATDLPSYADVHGGFVVAAAIRQYVYLGLARSFSGEYFLRYARNQQCERMDQIRHPILHTVLTRYAPEPVEIVSLADVPANTGLGSSGAFTVGLLKLLDTHQGRKRTAVELAEEATDIEAGILKRPIGRQDQYVAALGGLRAYTFGRENRWQHIELKPHKLVTLMDRLGLFYAGPGRPAANVTLADQQARATEFAMVANLDETKLLAQVAHAALRDADFNAFGECLNRQWAVKRERSPGITNDRLDFLYETACRAGALGGRLLGAGGGGFFLFYSHSIPAVRKALAPHGCTYLPFQIAPVGTEVLVRE